MPKQIQSLERGLFILETIVFATEPITALDISKKLGVHKSTVSHLTSTLVEQGYLVKEPGTAKFRPGPKAFRFARSLMLPVELLPVIRPHLEKLAAETGETAHIAELRGSVVFFVENAYPSSALRVQTMTGDFEAAHSTAVGKAILSTMPDSEIDAIYSGVTLNSFTEHTITDLASLKLSIEKARAEGIATDIEEQTLGTGCMAAPVTDTRGRVFAVGISGPVGRVADDDAHCREALAKCANDISRALGVKVRRTRVSK